MPRMYYECLRKTSPMETKNSTIRVRLVKYSWTFMDILQNSPTDITRYRTSLLHLVQLKSILAHITCVNLYLTYDSLLISRRLSLNLSWSQPKPNPNPPGDIIFSELYSPYLSCTEHKSELRMYLSMWYAHPKTQWPQVKMPNPSLEPPAATKNPNEDLKDMDVLCTFKIKI